MKEFNDRVAVVTGAASGIGRGMVENFVKLGMKAVLADIDADRLNVTLKSLKTLGLM
jgi:NADP-dependent 3-hydroxy acid dehydrogenase YdfG